MADDKTFCLDVGAGPIPNGLYVVATPIGNLEDITLRAISVLSAADLIAAEDTRHTAKLLSHYQIRTPLISCHEHNEARRSQEMIDKIRCGAAVALVSDAGTPMVSDPGYRLVGAVIEAGLDVFPIPGVSAAITALCASGLPTDTFVFLGFAPKKSGKRKELLASLTDESRTLVFYESPRRMAALLDEIQATMGDRQAVLARELTKLHEEFLRGRLSEVRETIGGRSELKGECTLLVAGSAGAALVSDAQLAAILKEALTHPDVRLSSLSRSLAATYKTPRKRVYDMALKIQKGIGKQT
ncbi:MAG: 16S rRNA (cytidine(1402)-2'-O)-methyltransferase [Proteobacteria bacterium]|nr:MAG: 16S rRNA (cytidine(1402)-2'-O)-methyltransferase [Pseudomonadota bacterium]PIE67476.1 MAG: 16S rRNA (cytidine(1402)-2'-O)-methyltransferase [Deltaproteobacteria bacterium]